MLTSSIVVADEAVVVLILVGLEVEDGGWEERREISNCLTELTPNNPSSESMDLPSILSISSDFKMVNN